MQSSSIQPVTNSLGPRSLECSYEIAHATNLAQHRATVAHCHAAATNNGFGNLGVPYAYGVISYETSALERKRWGDGHHKRKFKR